MCVVNTFEDPKFDRDKFLNRQMYYENYPEEKAKMFAKEKKRLLLLEKQKVSQ